MPFCLKTRKKEKRRKRKGFLLTEKVIFIAKKFEEMLFCEEKEKWNKRKQKLTHDPKSLLVTGMFPVWFYLFDVLMCIYIQFSDHKLYIKSEYCLYVN